MNEDQRRQRIRDTFSNLFVPRIEVAKSRGWVVTLTASELERVHTFASLKSIAKEKEWQGKDSKSRNFREITGASFEYGFLKHYHKEEYFDDEIVVHSIEKSDPDLRPSGILCDLKACKMNSVPLVQDFTKQYLCKVEGYEDDRYKCCNVIGVVNNETIYILGIATVAVLEKYVDKNLIATADNPKKTGFYGINDLLEVPNSWDELKSFCNQNIIGV